MKLICGVDIGNSTTEVAVARWEKGSQPRFLASFMTSTTGIKGTLRNVEGVELAVRAAMEEVGRPVSDLSVICINEAAPVLGDVAMETITETIVTESTMIGHNPDTPGGLGLGVGVTAPARALPEWNRTDPVIVVVDGSLDFTETARLVNEAAASGVDVQGAVVQRDEGVLIVNRLNRPIPVVDEVKLIDRVPLGMRAAVEVADQGQTIRTISNPYGIATVFGLTPEETKMIVPVARALIGNRSGVVIRTPRGDVQERRIPAGRLEVSGENGRGSIDVNSGAVVIMDTVQKVEPLVDVKGEAGTHVGGMTERIRTVMSDLTGQSREHMHIQDLLAVDTLIPQEVRGGVAGEFALENAVALAAMVKTNRLPLLDLAADLQKRIGVKVIISGVEADMAILGALTTPGTSKPLAIVDMGAGSTDAALISRDGRVSSIHRAGAGDMVTLLINSELGLNDLLLSEDIKRHPLAKVESLFHVRLEDGTVRFYKDHLDPRLYSRVVVLKSDGSMQPVYCKASMEQIRQVRREAKKKVFVTNALRAMATVAPNHDLRLIDFVVLVGGSALDFEVPDMVTDALAQYGVVAGRGNIRGLEGPRNAVATGLVLAYAGGGGE